MSSPPFPSNGHPYTQNGAPSFAQNGSSPYHQHSSLPYPASAPIALQPPPLLSHRPPGLPPPRMNPPPPLKSTNNDFGRGYGSTVPRQKRPHQDPEKVERTIFIENLSDTVDEQVGSPSVVPADMLLGRTSQLMF